MNLSTHILKFGGTSLKDPSLIRQSVGIVIDHLQTVRPVVVVSAVSGTTEILLNLVHGAATRSADIAQRAEKLRADHVAIFDQLVDDTENRRNLTHIFDELEQTLNQISKVSEQNRALTDRALSVGERASALIFASLLSQKGYAAEAFEASRFVKTDAVFGAANVEPEITRQLIRECLQHTGIIPVVTGFIGSDERQRITTLGRSGSDYTAGLLADALDADHLEIWTDVDGVLSADPRWVATAESINQLSFADINELSAHGAEVIHPKTIRPIVDRNTSVLVKNSLNPSHPGTQINRVHESNGSFKTVTISGSFVSLTVDEAASNGLFDFLREKLFSETDAEAWAYHRSSGIEPARFLIRQQLLEKIQPSLIEWAAKKSVQLQCHRDLFKVKKFSNSFSCGEQLTARILHLFATKNISPLEIKRNRGERFISFLCERDEARRAARLINDYVHPDVTTVDLFVAGTGAVGKTLMQQLKNIDVAGIKFRLLGVCNNPKLLWKDQGIDFHLDLNWSNAEKTDWHIITNRLTKNYRHNLIFIDATGSSEVARYYPTLMEAGIHVVTPSKLANTFEQSFFDEIQTVKTNNNVKFQYETTVGAGLPVISTVQNLIQSGDEIYEISGVVSGTMTYLFNQLEKGVFFRQAIQEARKHGYAEPDPRDDLSGEDVARKFLTLARTLGYKIERDELKVESLIPLELAHVDQETFLSELQKYDDQWNKRVLSAREKGNVLRYTGRIKEGKITIGIETVGKESPLGQLTGTDNLIQIHSRYYNQTPLIIQGAGAGKKVTAAGVLSGILEIAKEMK